MGRNRFLGQLAGLGASLALAGCCANSSCNCQDELADALFFKINYTTHRQYVGTAAASFNASDVDTIRLYRTNHKPSGKDTTSYVRQTDSVTVARSLEITASGDTTLAGQGIIVINNAAPFTSSGTTKLTGYDYRIAVISRRPGRRAVLTTYYVTHPGLQGRFAGTGCCTCYENTRKAYRLTTRLPTGTVSDSIVITPADTVNQAVRLRYAR